MNCRTLIENKGNTIRLGNALNFENLHQQRIDAKADTVAWIASLLNDFSFDTRLKKEIEKIKPEIKLRLLPNAGVLLCISFVQNVDFSYKSFDNVFVADWGNDYQTTLKRYKARPKWDGAVNSAFTRKQLYLWVTEL